MLPLLAPSDFTDSLITYVDLLDVDYELNGSTLTLGYDFSVTVEPEGFLIHEGEFTTEQQELSCKNLGVVKGKITRYVNPTNPFTNHLPL